MKINKIIGEDNISEFQQELSLIFATRFKLKIYENKNKNKNNMDLIKVNANVNSVEGKYISDIIEKYKFKNCLEVGLAHGISSVYILNNPNTKLISIDPFQKRDFNNEGLRFIKYLGLDGRHTFVNKKSYEALPEILEKDGNKTFDFIFIDGFHTFDYTLVDFFYSDLLLKIGGIIIVDDALHSSVRPFVNYIKTNYKHYRELKGPDTMAIFQKIKDDERAWNFHIPFC